MKILSEPSILKKLTGNPLIMFGLGFIICYLVLNMLIVFIGMIATVGVVLFIFRDRIDLSELLKSNKQKKGCPECGSLGQKHRKGCSKYGKAKKETS